MTEKQNEVEQMMVKGSDCSFGAEVIIGDQKGEDSKSAPIQIVARSGDAINHHLWGRVVHDFSTMRHNGRITLDYNHNKDEVVGYANKIDAQTDLCLSGALTPMPNTAPENDRAREILYKSKIDRESGGGIPYEASINFAGDFDVEYLGEGEEETVNGRHFVGPLTIIKNWPLRGCAITPYGYDAGTSATALNNQDRDIAVTIKRNAVMSTDTETVVDEKTAVNEADAETKSEAVDKTEKDSAEAGAAVDARQAEGDANQKEWRDLSANNEAQLDQPTGQVYMDTFGEQVGALYFAKGISLEDAKTQELARLRDRNAELEADLKKTQARSDDEACGFSQGGEIEGVLTEIPAPRATVVSE